MKRFQMIVTIKVNYFEIATNKSDSHWKLVQIKRKMFPC